MCANMGEVLFVSKPVSPPWNDSSKNLARTVALHLRRYVPTLMVRQGGALVVEGARVLSVYPAAGRSAFAPTVRDNLAVLRALLSSRRRDLWHFFFAPNPRAGSAARLARRCRRTATVHTACSMPAEGVRAAPFLFADVTVTLSEVARARFLEEGVAPDAVRFIPPCIPPIDEPTDSVRAELRRKHRLPLNAPALIYAGDLEFGRGATEAVRCLASWRNREGTLLMACRGKTRHAHDALRDLRARAHRWGVDERIRWVGETDAIHEMIALSDLMIAVSDSSYAKMDYPLVVLEAMCMGKPVLVGERTPAAELARLGAVRTVTADGEAIAVEVARLRENPRLLKRLGQTARQVATTTLSPNKVAGQYEMLYDELSV